MLQNLVLSEITMLRQNAKRLLHDGGLTNLDLTFKNEHNLLNTLSRLNDVHIWFIGFRVQVDNKFIDETLLESLKKVIELRKEIFEQFLY